jgi:uncharacterized protein (TIGR03437 family)
VFLGRADGKFARDIVALPPSFGLDGLVAATDMNGDRKIDIVGGWYSISSTMGPVPGVFILSGNGDGTFQPAVFPALENSTLARVADFNGDGIPDLLVYAGDFTVELGNGDGTFKPPAKTSGPLVYADSLGLSVIADLNNDGLADVAVPNEQLRGTRIFLSNGDGTFRLSGDFAAFPGSGPRAVAAGDINGDRAVDLVEQTPAGVDVELGNNTGTFRSRASFRSPMFTLFSQQPQVVLADFDGDGKLDFASSFYLFPGNGDGTLQPQIYFGQMDTFSNDTYPFDLPVVVQDVNGDGKPDIIGVGPDGKSIQILINSSGTPVASAPAYLAGDNDIVLAPGALASIFGDGLSTTTGDATPPLPTMIGNTSVELVDYAGKTFQAPLLCVSPTQINFQVPEGVAEGLAIINVTGNGRPKGAHSTNIQKFATSLFTLDGSGKGTAVSSAVRVDADGTQTPIPTTSCTPDGKCAGLPIPVSSTGQVYLSIYGTGFRHATAGQCKVGNATVTPTYIGPQSAESLIDQVNMLIPANTPKGNVGISCHFGIAGLPGLIYNYGNGTTVTITVQ